MEEQEKVRGKWGYINLSLFLILPLPLPSPIDLLCRLISRTESTPIKGTGISVRIMEVRWRRRLSMDFSLSETK